MTFYLTKVLSLVEEMDLDKCLLLFFNLKGNVESSCKQLFGLPGHFHHFCVPASCG